MNQPIVGVTVGDPSGIGPEVSLLGACSDAVTASLRPVLIGDGVRLHQALTILQTSGRLTETGVALNAIQQVHDARFQQGVVNVLDVRNVPDGLPWGEASTATGNASFAYLEKGVELALNGRKDNYLAIPPPQTITSG